MPTTRRRHTITETPRVEAALDAVREELGADAVSLPDLIILGAHTLLAQDRGHGQRVEEKRRALAEMIRSRSLPGDLQAGLDAHEFGWTHAQQ